MLSGRHSYEYECPGTRKPLCSITCEENWYEQMYEMLPERARKLVQNQKEYFTSWHHSVIRELLSLIDFVDDYKTLASYLYPPIRAVEAKRSIKLLRELELIQEDENGYWKPAVSYLFSEREAGPEWTLRYQEKMLESACP